MIKFQIKLDQQYYYISLDENMLMKDAMHYIFNEIFEYAYLHNHHYVEKLNKTFLEAEIQYGECIEIIRNI